MYIKEVLRICDTLCPNEYSDDEKYMWCDELSSMIAQEYLKRYDKIKVEASSGGEYLLPEGVTYEMVDRIIDGAAEIDKRDFRSYGIKYYHGRHGRFVLPARSRANDTIDVVYLKKHEPIRNIIINDMIKFTRSGFEVKNPKLIEGDSVTVTAGDTVFDDTAILGIRHIDETVCFITVPSFMFDSLFTLGETEKTVQCEIKRIVTDETVCDAPYDRMYVDFVNAQICYYQRDFDTYNQHINLFNQRLGAYQAWLQQRRVQDRDGRIVNWW